MLDDGVFLVDDPYQVTDSDPAAVNLEGDGEDHRDLIGEETVMTLEQALEVKFHLQK